MNQCCPQSTSELTKLLPVYQPLFCARILIDATHFVRPQARKRDTTRERVADTRRGIEKVVYKRTKKRKGESRTRGRGEKGTEGGNEAQTWFKKYVEGG